MATNKQIEVALHKDKPRATIIERTATGVKFYTQIENGTTVYFCVPLEELTDQLVSGIEAHLLIHWLDGKNNA